MNKNTKKVVAIVGILALAYYFILFNPNVKVKDEATKVDMTPAEKEGLFVAAMGYRGGAAPSREMLSKFQVKAEEAKAKIAELGLTKEFEEYSEKILSNYGNNGYQQPQ